MLVKKGSGEGFIENEKPIESKLRHLSLSAMWFGRSWKRSCHIDVPDLDVFAPGYQLRPPRQRKGRVIREELLLAQSPYLAFTVHRILYTSLHCVPITPNRPQLSPLKSLIGHLSNMATTVLPYSAQHYNSLPSIADAGRSLQPADIALLTTTIGQVFVKHKVQKLFGIILLHNHFSLDEDEILVNIGSVAVPWKTSSRA